MEHCGAGIECVPAILNNDVSVGLKDRDSFFGSGNRFIIDRLMMGVVLRIWLMPSSSTACGCSILVIVKGISFFVLYAHFLVAPFSSLLLYQLLYFFITI